MIKQLPEEYETVDMRYFRKKFSCPTTESFDELRGVVMAIIDQTNAQHEAIQRIIGRQHRHLADDHKKPKSTNIALRQRIAEMETALKHIIGISGAGLSAQERIADIKEMAKCGLDPQYSPILVGRYTYPLKTETSVVE